MDRNTAFTLALTGALAATTVACAGTNTTRAIADATSVATPGLVNVPALGGSRDVDPHVLDAIANGNDSCERNAGGSVLRFQYPPCPYVESRPPATAGLDWPKRWATVPAPSTDLRLDLPGDASRWTCATPSARHAGFSPFVPRKPSVLACASVRQNHSQNQSGQ